MKNGSTPSVPAGRCNAHPTIFAGAPAGARAAALARNPARSAIARMRRRVDSETPGRPFSAYDTAPLDTPASRAMSAMVGRCTPTSMSRPVAGEGRARRVPSAAWTHDWFCDGPAEIEAMRRMYAAYVRAGGPGRNTAPADFTMLVAARLNFLLRQVRIATDPGGEPQHRAWAEREIDEALRILPTPAQLAEVTVAAGAMSPV